MSDKEQIAKEVNEAAAAEPDQVEKDKAAQSEKAKKNNQKRDSRLLHQDKPKRPEGAPALKLIYSAYRREEVGIAELVTELLRGQHLHDNILKQWFNFNCTIWEKDSNRWIEQKIDIAAGEFEKEACRLYKASKIKNDNGQISHPQRTLAKSFKKKAAGLRKQNTINNILKILRRGAMLGMDSSDLDPHRELLPTLKSVVDLRTGKVFDQCPLPDLHFRCKSPWEYKGLNEPADFWESTLQKVFCGDQDLIDYFEYFVGFCVSGIQPKNFFVFLGQQGDNGKSVVFETIQKGLGEFASTVKVEMLLVDKFASADKASPSTVGLKGVRMAVSSEAEDTQWFSATKIKLLTSASDRIRARGNYQDDIEFSQTHTLCLHTNNVPKLKGADNPFMKNRLRIFPCNARFVDPKIEEFKNEDPDNFIYHMIPKTEVDEKLEAESSGILAWMVRCAMKAIDLGHMPPAPAAILAQNEDYEDEQDWCGTFLDQCCAPDPDSKLRMKDIYAVFAIWFRDEKNLSKKDKVLITDNRLGKEMAKRSEVTKISKKESRKGVPLYQGYKLNPNWVAAATENKLPVDKSYWIEQVGFSS